MQSARENSKPIEFALEFGTSKAPLADLLSQVMGPTAAQFDTPFSHSRILRLPEVMKRVGLSKTTIYDRIKKGEFPAQAKLLDGSRTAGWFEDEIDDYLAARRVAKPVQPSSLAASKTTPVKTDNSQTRFAPSHIDRSQKSIQAPEEILIATNMKILGCQVFLHKTTGKLLLDIGSSSSPEPLLTGLASPTRR